MRYRLRTLLILLAVVPPIVAWLTPPVCRWLFPPPPPAVPMVAGFEFVGISGASNHSGPTDPPPFVEIRLAAKRK